ncbi:MULTISPECIES: hypothetical protein [Paeniglutamicibacter]|uniref:Uncharacterized membrane protein YhaH (DUF805 family) n=1 Tax=Paeniglutamicibacter sulfureus TaxID=43666 RepID=A0ABU2BRD8_9MICC|nr:MULTISPECIES: hypothetical protein [Paeniglutamicibacter]MCV9994057.1 hypothetical protein [Paeniglutamicibacter sp. ZC-3]MDO2935924.1 hypothetical protein [Paeniglutamicibacter sulfureus]MDR7360313.1 uncharacterized membrane protein YhaH (DUF805 family) [Paeniglutamicibacter sulfureus]
METTGSGSSTSSYRANERLARERSQFGGVKVGSAFFGWVTAMGITVLLTALITAFGAGVGLATDTDLGTATESVAGNPDATAWISAIVLVLVLLLAYFCGGYVAGRMARFNGMRQGMAVWLWAIIAAIAVAALTVLANVKFEALGQLNGIPQLPMDGAMSALGWIALAIAVIVPLLGAILGGQAGMHYHRRVDRNSENIYRAP